MNENHIHLKCYACGEAENCDMYCELFIDKAFDVEDLACPVTGDETEWQAITDIKYIERIKELEAEKIKILHRVKYSLEKLGVEGTLLLIEQALKGGD